MIWHRIKSIIIMSQGRSVWRMIFQNFVKSLSIRPPKGRCVGEDELGNKYYEVLEGYKTNRKHPIRWFIPEEKQDWQQNLPAEWEAWLRNRRKDPPTIEEVMKNAAIAHMKKENAEKLKTEAEKAIADIKSSPLTKGFPSLEGLEKEAGSSMDEKKF